MWLEIFCLPFSKEKNGAVSESKHLIKAKKKKKHFSEVLFTFSASLADQLQAKGYIKFPSKPGTQINATARPNEEGSVLGAIVWNGCTELGQTENNDYVSLCRDTDVVFPGFYNNTVCRLKVIVNWS